VSHVDVVYWRDIPAQIRARLGARRVSRPLAGRFQEAIDAAAMRAGATATDAYLEEWRTEEAGDRPGEPEEAAATAADELEQLYPQERLDRLVENLGREEGGG
jgi:hypothetical protein